MSTASGRTAPKRPGLQPAKGPKGKKHHGPTQKGLPGTKRQAEEAGIPNNRVVGGKMGRIKDLGI